MEIVQSSNKQLLKMSKQEWTQIGVQAGWIKASGPMTKEEREMMLYEFINRGLDGNGRFDKKEKILRTVTEVLDMHGFNLDMVRGDVLRAEKDHILLTFRRKNKDGADPFTEEDVEPSRVVISYENLGGDQAQYEAIAYFN